MPSPWSDLDRPPLSQRRLARAVTGGLWSEVLISATTGSTNADLVNALRAGAEPGLVMIAEEQTSGRGRLGRTWLAPPRSSVLMSTSVVPRAAIEQWSLVPLLVGLAVIESLGRASEVAAELKWPNDVLVAGRKLAGILVERVETNNGPAIVIGIGINVSLRAHELPVPEATSIAVAGGVIDREPLVAELLRSLERRFTAWGEMAGDVSAIVSQYRPICATIGSDIELSLPGDLRISGRAEAVDEMGRLVVTDQVTGETHAHFAGDVTHVRPLAEQTGDDRGV